jgi:BMFP domain-containing protein YqiC
MSKTRKTTIRIELTEEQIKKIQESMAQEGASFEADVEKLEERIAPKNFNCM